MPAICQYLDQAHDLRAMDITNTSDPFAIVRLGHKEYRTKTMEKNLYPVWNETFGFVCAVSG